MDSNKIKVLLVDDSPLVLTLLKRILESSPNIEIVGTASNGKEALDLIPRVQPTLISTDLHMPVMDGLQFTREVMAKYPRPILVVSVSVAEGSSNVFRLLEAGAVDVFPKPRGVTNHESSEFAREFIQKIKILSGVRVFRRPLKAITAPRPLPSPPIETSVFTEAPLRIVVIGASTGGPQALQTILTMLPAHFPVPVICVQHIADGFLPGLVEWLEPQCRVKVTIAHPDGVPLPGTVFFAPEDAHLKFDQKGRFVRSIEPLVNGHRPSVTATMKSAAASYGNGVIGMLLTGMGNDGAEGMLAIVQAGGVTIAQDESSSIVFGMPKQAIELGAATYVMPLEKIADALAQTLRTLSGSRRHIPTT